jgi:hypothetical protein
MVSAFAARQRLVLGQVKVAEKSNEIVAIPALLTQVRPLPGLFVRPEIRDVLWFSKGRRRNQLIVPTLARSSGKDKSLHPWGSRATRSGSGSSL